MKTVTVEWLHYEKDGKTCDRCSGSAETIRSVLKKMGPALSSVKVSLELRETKVPEEQISHSNSVKVNGRDVMEVLGERKSALTACSSCTALTGKETCCSNFTYKGKAYDTLPEAMLEEAIISQVNVPGSQLTSPDAVKGECDCAPGCQPTGVNG